jgi:putative nucleotidyltransferase with HDIG domain
MSLLSIALPSPPDWNVDWRALDERFEWIRAMRGVPQDRVHHAEGDVWIHVSMVCQAMAALPEWRALAEADRDVLFTAALLHDVAKPAATRREDGRITARGHSRQGAIQARRILWESGAGMARREAVCALVRYHQTPFHLIERADALRMAILASQSTRCDLLAILARADALGRARHDREALLTRIDLFREFCREHRCLHAAWPFPSGLSRFEFAQREDRDPSIRRMTAPAARRS